MSFIYQKWGKTTPVRYASVAIATRSAVVRWMKSWRRYARPWGSTAMTSSMCWSPTSDRSDPCWMPCCLAMAKRFQTFAVWDVDSVGVDDVAVCFWVIFAQSACCLKKVTKFYDCSRIWYSHDITVFAHTVPWNVAARASQVKSQALIFLLAPILGITWYINDS